MESTRLNIANLQLEKSNEIKKTEKKLGSSKIVNFSISKKKIDDIEALSICRRTYNERYFVKLTQFEKTGSIDKTFISLGNLIINFNFRN